MKKPTVITIASNKGGVGKTTTATAFAHLLSKNYNVLIIDTDPQGNCASKFGVEPMDDAGPLGKLLQNRLERQTANRPLEEYLFYGEDKNIAVLSGGKALKAAVYDYAFSVNALQALKLFKQIIAEVEAGGKFDYVIIDTAPTFGNEINSILMATDWIISPVLAEMDAVEGANTTIKFLAPVQEENKNLKIAGVFFNQVVERSRAIHDIEPMLREGWGDTVLKTRIPYNPAAVAGAINEAEPVTKKFASSKVAKAYEQLLQEVLERMSD